MRQLKKHIIRGPKKQKLTGWDQRMTYQETDMANQPIFPTSLEYEDIDNAFFDFAKGIEIIGSDGRLVPTYTLYSNQRFSEYSQTWEHTDDEGNLLMNFKTVNRENNPKKGNIVGGCANIPGNRRYTVLMKEVTGDNGEEYYEIYSMKQPFSVDLNYKITFITTKYEKLNTFNMVMNDLFKATQCYIRPNGHFIPMKLVEITDETEYNIDNRKFFSQSASITVLAYIIRKDDFQIDRKPKRPIISVGPKKNRAQVCMNEYDDPCEKSPVKPVDVDIEVVFPVCDDNVRFKMEGNANIESIDEDNIRSYTVKVNNERVPLDEVIILRDTDDVSISINRIDLTEKSSLLLQGFDPYHSYNENQPPTN